LVLDTLNNATPTFNAYKLLSTAFGFYTEHAVGIHTVFTSDVSQRDKGQGAVNVFFCVKLMKGG